MIPFEDGLCVCLAAVSTQPSQGCHLARPLCVESAEAFVCHVCNLPRLDGVPWRRCGGLPFRWRRRRHQPWTHAMSFTYGSSAAMQVYSRKAISMREGTRENDP